jgi:hypothetical protein
VDGAPLVVRVKLDAILAHIYLLWEELALECLCDEVANLTSLARPQTHRIVPLEPDGLPSIVNTWVCDIVRGYPNSLSSASG